MGINPKTVAKWRKRATVEDMKAGPTEPRSTVLTEPEEAMVVAFRRHTLLPLDDCLYALQPSIQHLTRSGLHRCLQRHGISRLPDVEGDKPKRQKFKRSPIGARHGPRTGGGHVRRSTSTLPRCRRPRASSTCSSESTGLPSSPSLNALQRLTERPHGNSCSTCSRPCHTRSGRFLPTTGSSSPSSPGTATPSPPGRCAST